MVTQTAALGNLRQGDVYKNGLDCITKLKAAWTAQGALSQKKQKQPLNKIEIEQRKVLTTCKFIDSLTTIVLINHETNNPRGKWARDTGVGEKHTRKINTTETKILEFL